MKTIDSTIRLAQFQCLRELNPSRPGSVDMCANITITHDRHLLDKLPRPAARAAFALIFHNWHADVSKLRAPNASVVTFTTPKRRRAKLSQFNARNECPALRETRDRLNATSDILSNNKYAAAPN
ncbi:hypothetical protein NP493_882g01013 [Ridgeia piscesae]|uniref:Uncharacterized protein n=1 Tax=Ridgeia piscesae TaxID=27915 RepID=A0AAD9KLF8_RIDPI|nr:hypothetical protein NP493_882g01013 [Ridgeia piscesae]